MGRGDSGRGGGGPFVAWMIRGLRVLWVSDAGDLSLCVALYLLSVAQRLLTHFLVAGIS